MKMSSLYLPARWNGGLSRHDNGSTKWVIPADRPTWCAPARWRDEWLVSPRPGGDEPVIGAVARTIDEWREHIAINPAV